MKSARYIKNPNTYIKMDSTNGSDIITVEHRSNNPKRDYLFVNRLQCKHIPCSPSAMIDMCKNLANKVNSKLADMLTRDESILVIGFAETATAIGSFVAQNLKYKAYIMHTTREDVLNSKELIRFEEEHSHATTQKLLTYYDHDTDKFLSRFSYILFVEDEISTGKTILNFIDAFKKAGLSSGRQIKFGVASICNWQNSECQKIYKDNNIDTFSLLSGELLDTNAKMDIAESQIYEDGNHISYACTNVYDIKDFRSLVLGNIFGGERLGGWDEDALPKSLTYKNLIDRILEITRGCESVRIIGTEEFMYIPISIGKTLEEYGKNVICHATTRSKIDVMKSEFDGEGSGIKLRCNVRSAYENGRNTYIYNTNEPTDIVLVITDSNNRDLFEHTVADIKNAIGYFGINIVGIVI